LFNGCVVQSDFEAGGAIAGLSDNDFMISFCTFIRNRAYLGAGAINFQQSHWSIQVKDSIFKFNQGLYGAGAIFFGEQNLNIQDGRRSIFGRELRVTGGSR
jgi:hypothetical protein